MKVAARAGKQRFANFALIQSADVLVALRHFARARWIRAAAGSSKGGFFAEW
jgi:hypothetical protein